MWYEGNGGTGKRIGYAFSENGISGWSKDIFQSISIGSYDNWEKEVSGPVVIFDTATSTYKMWYTSLNSDHWTSGLDRFRLRYASSSADLKWNIYPNWSMYGSAGSWDSGGIWFGKSIIKDVKYRLWYAGTNESSLGSNSYWRIGYATSTDGILNWTKENNGNPITIQNEVNNVTYPTLLFLNNIYHMWYSSGIGDFNNQINYAYSKDGIIWIKTATENPVLTRTPGTFDQSGIIPNTVLMENDVLKMWYSGYDGAHWRIGYATASASILPTPDPETIPTAAPLPTSTPTATPTPTPTPTPPPPPTKKIVVIPGVTASWNPDALLSCKLNDYTGEWTLFHLAQSVYNPLLDALTKAGWIPTIYPYDWRKPVSENEPALASFINNLTPGWHEKVDIVGHSMGGLLARSYITQEQSANKTEKFLSVGSPHLGTVAAYPTWEAGQIWEGDLGWKFILTLLKKNCSARNKINDRTTVQTYFTSVNNLLPVFDYLTDDATGQPIHYGDMQEKNHFLTDNRFPFYLTSVATLRGTGQETTIGYRVGPIDKHDAPGDWIDGKPVSRSTTTEGDGTVLLTSSEIPEADNTRVIPVNHTGLLSSAQGIEKILGFLGAAPQTIQSVTANIQPQAPAPTSGLFVIGYPADFWIVDPNGQMTKDERNLQVFPNPKPGKYKLVLLPGTGTTRLIVAQFLPNGKILWKEYQLKNRLPKIKTIKFDPDNPLEDALQ